MIPESVTANDPISNHNKLPQLCNILCKKKIRLFKNARPLTSHELKKLTAQGNRADDWNTITVDPDFTVDAIHHSIFSGNCYLGNFCNKISRNTLPVELPTGIYNSALFDTVVSDNCCIWHCSAITNYYLDSEVVLFNCGSIHCAATANFGNGVQVTVGNETGGREVVIFADLSMDRATAAAYGSPPQEKQVQAVADYCQKITTGFGIIARLATLCNCPVVSDSFIGEATEINHATQITSSTLLSNHNAPIRVAGGAIINHSIVQAGSMVDTLAIVERSLIAGYARVERHGKVSSSIIGSNTGIAEGEVTSCLVGPFVGFHHQALLIGALWPDGKGNVAYGANVGSNHTARAPDQELYCGEGLFFGLGVNIKFPADFSEAPYTIIATGASTLPQRMTFPFSLINTPSEHISSISPAINELIPAWVLSENLYLVKRNEAKFTDRGCSTQTPIDPTVFRPTIVEGMISARNTLLSQPTEKPFYTDTDIPGAGKNYITHRNVVAAITTYTLHIRYYCFKGIFRQMQIVTTAKDLYSSWNTLDFSPLSDNKHWEHCRQTTFSEKLLPPSPDKLLNELEQLQQQMTNLVIRAKKKDTIRGQRIMKEYDYSHLPIEKDPFIIKTLQEQDDFLGELAQIRTLLH